MVEGAGTTEVAQFLTITAESDPSLLTKNLLL